MAIAFAAVACGDGSEATDSAVELGDAVSLPAASSDGSVLVYRAIRDGLLNSVGVEAASGDELWTVVDSSFEPTLGRPAVFDDVLFAVDFDDESLRATIRAVDVATGQELWSSPLGPHYAGPYSCGADLVCVHAHPEAAPVSTWQFEKDSGTSTEGRTGARTIYADDEIQVSELTPGETLGLSRDADTTTEWTSPIVDVFGPDHGTVDGHWARRSANRLVVWLGKAGVLDSTFAVFDIDDPEPVTTFPGIPCLIDDDEVDVICTRSGDQLRLLDWEGNVIDELTAPLPEGEVVPDHIFDDAGRLLIVADESYRLTPEGFIAASAPTSGWCPADDLAATETARSQPVEVTSGRYYYPCSRIDGEPLDHDHATRLARHAADSANSERLLTATSDNLAFHPGPSIGLTVTGR